jgi:hypothetical protein
VYPHTYAIASDEQYNHTRAMLQGICHELGHKETSDIHLCLGHADAGIFDTQPRQTGRRQI